LLHFKIIWSISLNITVDSFSFTILKTNVFAELYGEISFQYNQSWTSRHGFNDFVWICTQHILYITEACWNNRNLFISIYSTVDHIYIYIFQKHISRLISDKKFKSSSGGGGLILSTDLIFVGEISPEMKVTVSYMI
jgi:hypothetical protein